MEGDNKGFSAISSLIRLIPFIDIKTSIDDICKEIVSVLSERFGIDKSVCLRYQKEANSLSVLGMSQMPSEEKKSIAIDQRFSEWLGRIKDGALEVIEASDDIPKQFVEILAADERHCIAIYMSRDTEEAWSLILLSTSHEFASALDENKEELKLLFRGVVIIMETLRKLGEILLLRFDIQSIFNIAPVGILICDEEGTIIGANKQALLIIGCGLGSDTLVGENLLNGEPFKDSGIRVAIKKAISGEQLDLENFRFRCPSGKSVYLDIRVRATSLRDGKIRVISILSDVTQRVKLQQQLERSYMSLTEAYQELQRVDKMKTRFIDTVSHELRTPLTVMRGYLELLQAEYYDKLDPKIVGKLKSIRANTERLYDLVEAMLDVARIEQGAMEIVKQEASIKNLIEEVLSSQRRLAHDKRQEITLIIEGEIAPISIDQRKIRDALKNILNNAIRYTPEGGKIQVGLADEGKMIHIWVKDNGIGIPTSELEKIFDRFHIVVAKDLSHQVDRMGLGLPLAKGIVVAHGGKIWVESEVGKGSVFHIHLPRQ